jgi:hypothetical protein
MPPPRADRGKIITYTVVQRTTSKNDARTTAAFMRELQLQYGRTADVTHIDIKEVDEEVVQSWERIPERPSIDVEAAVYGID